MCRSVWCCSRTCLCSSEGVLAAAGGAHVELLAGCCLLLHLNVLILLQVSKGHNVRVIAGGQQSHMLFPCGVIYSLKKTRFIEDGRQRGQSLDYMTLQVISVVFSPLWHTVSHLWFALPQFH